MSLLVFQSRKGPQKPEYVDRVVVTAVGMELGAAVLPAVGAGVGDLVAINGTGVGE